MKTTRDSDLRKVHDRPDGWWGRINWDYEHKTFEERQKDGARNLVIIITILAVAVISVITVWLAIVSGSVALAVVTMLYILGRGRR